MRACLEWYVGCEYDPQLGTNISRLSRSRGSLSTKSMSILPIENTSIHRITSGQVIVDLQSAVKELVENSLDAGATNIGAPTYTLSYVDCSCLCGVEVRFKEYGLKSVEVIDNGSGIAEEDHDSIGKPIHPILPPCTNHNGA